MIDQLHSLLHGVFDPITRMLDSVGLGLPELATLSFIVGVCISLPWINIFRKAGYSPLKGYLMLIPVVNIYLFLRFAFGTWPLEREFRKLDPSAAWREF